VRSATIGVDVNVFISADIEGIAGIVDWQRYAVQVPTTRSAASS
jgi:D-aminopeptidase